MIANLKKAKPDDLQKARVTGIWFELNGKILYRKFGGADHPMPKNAKRGPNDTILLPTRELLARSQQ
jgi:hypothetical protein